MSSPTSLSDPAARTVSYNSRAFVINGEPELFLSACIHYFRVPHRLWADRIARAKRGGMNTIETYVAWNLHEPTPGVFDWDGDRDLDAFITECERQGMYVIVRPGPYICAEWDYGGFPAWLQTVPGIEFRTMNAPYLAAVDRYFDAVTPIIARHQWTRGGGVVLVQVENEYANLRATRGSDMLVDDDYQHYVRDGLLRRGIEVPLLSCAGYCSGTVEGVNSHNPGDLMPQFRETFPDKPLFSTEFWTAWYDSWGQPHHTRSAADIEYASLRCFAEGACGYNYYVYHGGTNFGYTPMYLQTTSYDYDAPISETGRLTDKWRAARRVALWARTFREILLTGEHRRDLPARGGLRVTETATKERGAIVFIDNPHAEETVTGSVLPYLPEVTLAPRELLPWVHDVPIGYGGPGAGYLAAYAGLVKSDAPVLAAHVLPDPHDGSRLYVYGEPGQDREVVLWSGGERAKEIRVTFADEPRLYLVGMSQVIALSPAMAGRTWIHPTDENAPVLLGADDVREHGVESAVIEAAPNTSHTLYALAPDGLLSEINVETPARPAPPALSSWRTTAEPSYADPAFDDSAWRRIEDLETEGNMIPHTGSNPYGWYRAIVETPDGGDATLHFAACSDRLTLWLNGERIGSSTVPPEDRRTDWTASFEVPLPSGTSTLCVLADGLGLIKGDWQIGKGQEHEKKGIYGPVTLTVGGACYQIEISRWRFQPFLYGEQSGWWGGAPMPPAVMGEETAPGAPIRWHRATFRLDAPLDTATPLLVRLDGMGKGVLWLNGRNLGRYWQDAGPQRDYYAPEPWLLVGENVLVLVETEGNWPEQVSLVWDEKSSVVTRITLGG
ncbi:MAG: beta-galactosidase [Cytophagales bacterium]|nr:beta-galactosidase [Armatimonadota bacterium]